MSRHHRAHRDSRQKKALREKIRTRDGDACWYCGKGMSFDTTDCYKWYYATVEHLVSLVEEKFDPRDIENAVLAHKLCNERVRDKSLEEKHKIRNRKRYGKESYSYRRFDR